MKDQFRTSLSPLREPKFDCLVLSRTTMQNERCVCEPLHLSKLPDRLILVIGGLQSSCDASQHFAAQLEKQLGHPKDMRFGIFDYPNDGSLRDSGDTLRLLLTRIATASPKTKMTLVTHSMGGLIARHAIETKKADPVGLLPVDQLVMICPPNHGSVLAQYADVLEFADVLERTRTHNASFSSYVLSFLDDGLGEACEDLIPNSRFLEELNQNGRAAGVRYSIFAGNQGPIDPVVHLTGSLLMNELSRLVRKRDNELPILQRSVHRTSELFNSEELTMGLGDGAVSLQSARLDGVDDFVKMPIQHTQWCTTYLSPVKLMIQMVAARIQTQ